MKCRGCGNPAAAITRTWWDGKEVRHEVCDRSDCGNLRAPWHPDVYFRKPEIVENLADAQNPFGRMVESRRHKAQILREQGIREDGDRVRGSREKGVKKPEMKLSPEFIRKRDAAVAKAITKFKKDRGAPTTVPLKMVRRKV